MPTFEYQAEGVDGKTVTGVVIGNSLDQAVHDLSVRGLMVLKIGAASHASDPLSGLSGGSARPKETSRTEAPAPVGPYGIPESSGGPETAQRSYAATSVVGPLVGQVALSDLLFFFRQLATMLEAGGAHCSVVGHPCQASARR